MANVQLEVPSLRASLRWYFSLGWASLAAVPLAGTMVIASLVTADQAWMLWSAFMLDWWQGSPWTAALLFASIGWLPAILIWAAPFLAIRAIPAFATNQRISAVMRWSGVGAAVLFALFVPMSAFVIGARYSDELEELAPPHRRVPLHEDCRNDWIRYDD